MKLPIFRGELTFSFREGMIRFGPSFPKNHPSGWLSTHSRGLSILMQASFGGEGFMQANCLRKKSKPTPTPLKFNMEPENKLLEKEIPFGNHHFQVPC